MLNYKSNKQQCNKSIKRTLLIWENSTKTATVILEGKGQPGILGLLHQFPGFRQPGLCVLQHCCAVWKSGCQILQLVQLSLQISLFDRQLGFQDPVTHLLDVGQVGGRVWTYKNGKGEPWLSFHISLHSSKTIFTWQEVFEFLHNVTRLL